MYNSYYRQLPSASTLPGFPTMQTSPTGPYTPPKPAQPGYPTPTTISPTLENMGYTQAFLRSKIGKRVRIEFLIGTTSMVDRDGIIEEVGISYIVLREPNTGDLVMCDLYSIKFVTFYD